MAEETVDKAIEVCDLQPASGCITKGLPLDGARNWTPTMFIRLIQDYGLDAEVAQHLANTYGDRAFAIAKQAKLSGQRWPIVGRRLHEDYPYTEAEVLSAEQEQPSNCASVLVNVMFRVSDRVQRARVRVHCA